MRDSLKVTVQYQFIRIILMQAAASGIAFVFCAVAFWYFTNINIVKQLISVVFMAVNFILLYTTSKKFAVMDGRDYTPLKQSKLKGALFGAAVSVLNAVFMLIFILLWKIYGTDEGIMGIFPTAYNAFFVLWTYPYNGIMNLQLDGTFTVYSAIIMLILPIAATLAGYIAGCKRFDFVEKIDALMYEKDDESN